MALLDRLNNLHRKHYVCEDCWYTCPSATEEIEGERSCSDISGECNCGADEFNKELDEIIKEVKDLIAVVDWDFEEACEGF